MTGRDAGTVVLAVLPFVLAPLLLGTGRTAMGIALGVVVVTGYAVGVNVVYGLTGQLFLCIGALGAVGGYGTAVLGDDVGLPAVVALLLSVAAASGLGALFCWLSVRRSLDVIFTGIVTLTFGLGFQNLLLGQRAVTGGEDGRRVETAADTLLDDRVAGYYVVVALVAAFLLVFRWLERSHHGWAYRALRDDETTAALAGVDVARHRVQAGAIGAAMIGAVGGLEALVEGRIAPDLYRFADVDVGSIVVVALGGVGHLLAPVLGATTLGLLDELWLRQLGTLRVAVFGGVLVALFLLLPDGIVGTVRRLGDRPLGGLVSRRRRRRG